MRNFYSKKVDKYFYKIVFTYFFCFFCFSSFAQVITTYAGNGYNGEVGDGGTALNAGIVYPSRICLDRKGNLYITGSNKVRKVDATTGVISTIAGGGGCATATGDGGLAVNACLKFTYDVFVDKFDNVFIAEYSGHRIRKVDGKTGIITTVAGNGIAGFSGDGGLAINASLNTPQSICVDTTGNLFIADSYNSRIRKVDIQTGIISTVAGTGSTNYSGDGGLAVNAGTPYVVSVELDNNGNLYFIEVHSTITCRVRKIDMVTGIVNTIAGKSAYAHEGDGGLAINASLFDPNDLCFDKAGNIYIAQYDDSRIRKIDAVTGIINTIAGTGTNGFSGDCGDPKNAQMHYPMGVAMDDRGNLFVSDNMNHRIRKVSLNTSINSITNKTICESALPFSWNGLSITSAGTYSVKLRPASGGICDSTATLVLNVNPFIVKDVLLTACANELPVKWNGHEIKEAGSYAFIITAATGCDTLARVILKVNQLKLSIVNTPTNCGNNIGTATVNASGVKPYRFIWNTVPVQTDSIAIGLTRGTYTVQVTDSLGCIATANAVIDVDAINQPPIVQSIKDTNICVNESGSYIIAKPTYTSACGLSSINFKISGATTREGSGIDASGKFNPGLNLITWTFKDIYNNQVSSQGTVLIKDNFKLNIPDVNALPKGTAKNTVYLGYTQASSVLLTGEVTGNSSGYKYLWSTGDTSHKIAVSPTVSTTYHFEVTDMDGCRKEITKSIYINDIRCGNNLDKVLICLVPPGNPENENRICIDSSAVATHLANGSYLGACLSNPPQLASKVFANPSNDVFTITVQSVSSDPVTLKLYNQFGKLVESKQNVQVNTLITIGNNILSGLYILETTQGDKRSSIKLIKM